MPTFSTLPLATPREPGGHWYSLFEAPLRTVLKALRYRALVDRPANGDALGAEVNVQPLESDHLGEAEAPVTREQNDRKGTPVLGRSLDEPRIHIDFVVLGRPLGVYLGESDLAGHRREAALGRALDGVREQRQHDLLAVVNRLAALRPLDHALAPQFGVAARPPTRLQIVHDRLREVVEWHIAHELHDRRIEDAECGVGGTRFRALVVPLPENRGPGPDRESRLRLDHRGWSRSQLTDEHGLSAFAPRPRHALRPFDDLPIPCFRPVGASSANVDHPPLLTPLAVFPRPHPNSHPGAIVGQWRMACKHNSLKMACIR